MAGLIITKLTEQQYNSLTEKQSGVLYLITDSKDEERLLAKIDKKIRKAVAELASKDTVNKSIAQAVKNLRNEIKESIGLVTADLSDLIDGKSNTFDLPPDAKYGYMVFVDGVQKTVFENNDRTFTLVETPDKKSELIVKYLTI